jgi:hypothetical protein
MNICTYCKGAFSSKSALSQHQTKARYCLNIQLKLNPETIIVNIPCRYCNKNFTRNCEIISHEAICKSNKSSLILEYENKLKEKDIKINKLKLKLEGEISKKEIYKELYDNSKTRTN